MHLILGYSRATQVNIERETSKLALVGLAILIIALVIFLSFEDIDEQIRASDLVSDAPSGSVQIAGADNSLEIDSKRLWRSELENSQSR